ncbi:MAG: chaperonin GroEL [Anaerolineae bacterium]
MGASQRPGVVFQPKAYQGMQRGINQMVAAIRPTLGPLPRLVAIGGNGNGQLPELLDNGALIARRMVQLPDRDADMGAMFIRHMLWQVHEKVGDGTATTALLFQTLYSEGVRYSVAGGNSMRLRHYLEEGMQLILAQLDRLAIAVEGKEKLAQVAESICYDPPLSKLLGEIFDIVGEYGQVDIRTGRGRGLEREYVEGMHWNSGLFSRQMITDHLRLRTDLVDSAILISDLDLEEPGQVLPLLETTLQAGIRSLMMVAHKFSERVVALLLSASREPDNFQVIAVKTPGLGGIDQVATLEDLAILTGGRPIVRAAGDTLKGVRLEDLGRARRVWADHHYFGISGGKGNPGGLRSHLVQLRAAFARAASAEQGQKLQQRIGKLMGGSATLYVGGATEPEIKARQETAQRTAAAMRGAVREGVLPGGGVALLACQPILRERLTGCSDPDQRAAYRLLIKALETPIRTIAHNAGYEAAEVMAQIQQAEGGYGFDVRTGQVVNMAQAGIWDAAAVVKTAVHSAVASAGLALSTEVLIHRRKSEESLQP